jgi:transcriptional regulator with XRE-family HTH domain
VPRDRAALGAFLRARRDRLTPAQAGIEPFPGARRVPGLRREELAVLAGLSPDYYSRLEQGRQSNVSLEVLDALARALRLMATLDHVPVLLLGHRGTCWPATPCYALSWDLRSSLGHRSRASCSLIRLPASGSSTGPASPRPL